MPAVGDQHRDPSSNAVTANPFDESSRHINEYTAQQVATLQSRLDKQLGPEYISSRSGPSGQKVHYLAAEKCINLANEVFGFNGWSSSIQSIQIDFVDENSNTGKISLGLSVIVRVTLKDGTYHEDVGYGHIENCKGKAAAFEKAKKEGTTDGLKRALRTFGNVLGNCIYDKDYLARVTRLKITPSKWDAENLHRHPDYAPIKKEPVQNKRLSEDMELPPLPVGSNTRKTDTPHDTSLTFDGDGEFGSDVFDEADFVTTTVGNPDEISLDADTPQQLQRPQAKQQLPSLQQRQQGYQPRPVPSNSAIVTPSKPERAWAADPINRIQSGASAGNFQVAMHAGNDTNNSSQEFQRRNNFKGIKTENTTNISNPSDSNMVSVNNEQNMPKNGSTEASVGFYSARAVELLRENPRGSPMAPKFDPHAESPSIRKTAGIDHTKSVPVSKPMIFGTSPSPAAATRDFINPSTDAHRRIGAPGGNSGMASPAKKGFTTSSYRPLTRPTVDNNKNATNTYSNNNNVLAMTAQDTGLKRPPLNDVTNAPPFAGSTSIAPGPGDIKRPRLGNNESAHNMTAQQNQQR